jgi:hypothetical protein
VLGKVMEGDEPASPRCLAEADTLLPCRVAPAPILRILLVREGGVVDDDLAAGDELDDACVASVLRVLGIGDVADRAAVEVDPVSRSAARVIENGGSYGHIVVELKGVAGVEVVEPHARVHDVEGHGEEW